MSKYKYLIKNMGLLTLSNFATKLLSFFLVPLYTSVLSTAEYGKYDFISSTVGILVPILTINIYEAVLRYSMDKEAGPKDVFSIGLKFCLIGNSITILFLIVNHFFTISYIIDDLSIYFFLIFFTNSISGIISSMARGLDRIKEISIASVIGSIITITLNIVLLCVVKLGIDGYFLANIFGILSQMCFLFVCMKGWKYISFKHVEQKTNKEMIHYSLPTIANAIAWWVNGLADRYVIIFFLGISANGVYSVASKIPSILNIFQNIFSQAFMLSAVKEFDKDDTDGFFRKIFSTYNFVLVMVCSLIICADKILARYLYANDFYDAWRFVPFLTISIIFGSLSGYAGSIFAALKHSEYFAKCSGSGAVANICMNIVLVPLWGALGAAIATAISYWIVYLVSMFYLNRSMNVKISLMRDTFAYGMLMLQAFILLNEWIEWKIQYGIQIIFVVVLLILYKSEIKYFISKLISLKGN